MQIETSKIPFRKHFNKLYVSSYCRGYILITIICKQLLELLDISTKNNLDMEYKIATFFKQNNKKTVDSHANSEYAASVTTFLKCMVCHIGALQNDLKSKYARVHGPLCLFQTHQLLNRSLPLKRDFSVQDKQIERFNVFFL